MNGWQTERARFNHDWLKNQMMPATAKLVKVLKGSVQDDDFVESFVESMPMIWKEHVRTAKRLVGRFESEMSPKIYFDVPPLSSCDEQSLPWLREVTDKLWRERLPVSKWISDAIEAIADADSAFDRLFRVLSKHFAVNAGRESEETRIAGVDFHKACHALAEAFSRFPNRVLP